jgi:hypothetical protein
MRASEIAARGTISANRYALSALSEATDTGDCIADAPTTMAEAVRVAPRSTARKKFFMFGVE